MADVIRAIPSATLLDDKEPDNDFRVPDDFPSPKHSGAVPGAQTRFLAVEFDGRYYSPGSTPPELHARWQNCMHLVPQFVTSYIETKAGKRKDMPEVEILDQYLVRLVEAKWVSDDEARWVIREAAKLLYCLVSCDHIPHRSMALFRAKAVLDELIAGLPPRSSHRLHQIA